MTEMDIETSVYYVHLTRLIAREDFIKFTRRESTKTYIENLCQTRYEYCNSTFLYNEWQLIAPKQETDRPVILSERAPRDYNRTVRMQIKIWPWVPHGARRQDWLTDRCEVKWSDLDLYAVKRLA
jgi:hypothetical protein